MVDGKNNEMVSFLSVRCFKENKNNKLVRGEMLMNKKVKYYMNLPYNYIIQQIHDESGSYYYAKVLELDGCQSTGETFEEAYSNVQEAMNGWLEAKIVGGYEIPLPKEEKDYSGRFVIRIPKTLHYRLAIEAEKEGVSLNQYALYKLAR